MKRILIGDNREELVSTLESLLKNWGYRTIAADSPESFIEMLDELEPDVLILGPEMAEEKKVGAKIEASRLPRIFIQDPAARPDWLPKGEFLDYPVDVFRLFSLVQSHLEQVPRRNIRLNVKMPGLYYKGSGTCIAEVLSLSPEGLFLKTGSKLEDATEIQLVLPLIGMQTELEINGRIVYKVEPAPHNNYMQGMGIEFINLEPATRQILEQYVEGLLFNELNERQSFRDALNTEHLRKHGCDATLHLTKAG